MRLDSLVINNQSEQIRTMGNNKRFTTMGTSEFMVLIVGCPGRGKMRLDDDMCDELHELKDALEELRVVENSIMSHYCMMMIDHDMVRDIRQQKTHRKGGLDYVKRWNRDLIEVELPVVAVGGTRNFGKDHRFRRCIKKAA